MFSQSGLQTELSTLNWLLFLALVTNSVKEEPVKQIVLSNSDSLQRPWLKSKHNFCGAEHTAVNLESSAKDCCKLDRAAVCWKSIPSHHHWLYVKFTSLWIGFSCQLRNQNKWLAFSDLSHHGWVLEEALPLLLQPVHVPWICLCPNSHVWQLFGQSRCLPFWVLVNCRQLLQGKWTPTTS